MTLKLNYLALYTFACSYRFKVSVSYLFCIVAVICKSMVVISLTLFKKLFEMPCTIIPDNGITMTHYKYNNNKTLQEQSSSYILRMLQYDRKGVKPIKISLVFSSQRKRTQLH